MADYEVSPTYVDSLVRALRQLGKFELVYKASEPGVQHLLSNPYSDAWQPALLLEGLGAAVVQVGGMELFAELSYAAMKARFGGIVLPMLKASLAASGQSPAAILARLDGVVKVAIKGVSVTWQADGGNAGTLAFVYPRRVAPQVEASWRGVLRFVFEATKKEATGKVASCEHANEGAALVYRVEW